MSTPLTSRQRSFNILGGGPVLSPQTRRSLQSSIGNQSNVESPLPEVQNEEDIREKKEKRRSRTLVTSANSPLVRPSEDQGEAAKLTNDQLASHYVNCIKLSTENKITAKNAFNLHLIDHMNEMLKQRCEGVLNFQMAGGTIFASAKIYASRVDAVHSEAYKVMSSLGRGANEDKEGGSDGESQESETRETTRKKKKRSKILESNPAALRIKKMDACYMVDPLDQYYSSVFDVANTSGLLINHLGLCKDGITVRFDSDMESPIMYNVSGGRKPAAENPEKEIEAEESTEDLERKQEIDGMFQELVKLSSVVTNKKATVCPTLSDFTWNDDDHSFDLHESGIQDSADNVSPIEADNIDEPDFDVDDVIMDSAPDQDDFPFVSPNPGANDEVSSESGSKSSFPLGMDAQLLTAFEPGEYSYFKPGAFSTWEGPNHWKMKLRNKAASAVAPSDKASEVESSTKGKKRKRNFYVDYRSGKIDIDDKEFERTRKATEISKRTREKWRASEDDRLLPSAGEYSIPDLAKCVLQPAVHIRPVSFIRNAKDDAPQVDTDQLGMYNYDNPNDKNNYCPNIADDDDGDPGDNQDDIPSNFASDYSNVDHGDGFPDMTLSQTQVGSQLDIGAMLKGDHLISHPKKVEKISIEYAKKAKRIDVRRLKAAMWTVLHRDDDTDQTDLMQTHHSRDETQSGDESDEDENESNQIPKTFSDMYTALPKLMPTTMAENLSIPLAFTCLLHLANEKSLKIVAKPDMSDLNITEPIVDAV